MLLAFQELLRWERRRDELKHKLSGLPHAERRNHRDELLKVNQQIAYYKALISDMKKVIHPPRITALLNSL